MKTGIIGGLSEEAYLAIDAVSASRLISIDKTPADVRAMNIETDATRFGTVAHSFFLEPDSFRSKYGLATQCCGTLKNGGTCRNGGKERHGGGWYCGIHAPDAEPEPIIAVSQPEFLMLETWAKRCSESPAIRALFEQKGESEVTLLWTDPETGLYCKARCDWLTDENNVGEVKTASDASPEGFAKAVANYNYYRKEAWYRRGLEVLGRKCHEFQFVVLEKGPAALVATYTLDADALELGRGENRLALERYADCVLHDEWPGYDVSHALEISLPSWKAKKPNPYYP